MTHEHGYSMCVHTVPGKFLDQWHVACVYNDCPDPHYDADPNLTVAHCANCKRSNRSAWWCQNNEAPHRSTTPDIR